MKCLDYAVVILGCAAFASACGGGDSDDGPCGTVMCATNQTCDRGSSPPVCRCADAYTGPSCSLCNRGYVMSSAGTCQRVLIDCSSNSSICRPYGTCVGSPDRCVCNKGYTGHACQICD